MEFREEIERIHRVSDLLTTAHAILRDRYALRAAVLDIVGLAISTWLVGVVFVEPRIGLKLTPDRLDPHVWVGILGIFTFFLAIAQLRVDWKGKSDAHKRSFEVYAAVKGECRSLLSSGRELNPEACQRVLTQYDMAVRVGAPVPETQFLTLKQNHLRKVAISKHLDEHPGASILLLKARMWWRDNR